MPYMETNYFTQSNLSSVGIFKLHKHIWKPNSAVLSSCFSLCSPGRLPYKAKSWPYPIPNTAFYIYIFSSEKYGRPKNVSTFPTNGTRDRHILIYSLELKVTALAASPNQAHTVTARHHVSIQTIRLALPAEFNVSGVVVTVITQSYDTKRRIVSLTTTSWPQ